MAGEDGIIIQLALAGDDDVIQRFEGMAKSAAQSFAEIGAQIGGVTEALGIFAAGITAIIAATTTWAVHSTKVTVGMGEIAQSAGMTTSQLSGLKQTLSGMGADSDALGQSFRRMAFTIQSEWRQIVHEYKNSADKMVANNLAVTASAQGVEKAHIAVREATHAGVDRGAEAALKVAEAYRAQEEAELKYAQAQKKRREDQLNSVEAVSQAVGSIVSGETSLKGAGQSANLDVPNIMKGLIANAGPAVEAVQDFKGGFQDIVNQSPQVKQVFEDLADFMKNSGDEATNLAVAIRLLGRGVNQDMVQAMSQLGSEGIRANQERLEKLGLTLTDKDKGLASAFTKSFQTLSGELGTALNQIGDRVIAPGMTKMFDDMRASFEKNRDVIMQFAQSVGNIFGNAFEGVKTTVTTAFSAINASLTATTTLWGLLGVTIDKTDLAAAQFGAGLLVVLGLISRRLAGLLLIFEGVGLIVNQLKGSPTGVLTEHREILREKHERGELSDTQFDAEMKKNVEAQNKISLRGEFKSTASKADWETVEPFRRQVVEANEAKKKEEIDKVLGEISPEKSDKNKRYIEVWGGLSKVDESLKQHKITAQDVLDAVAQHAENRAQAIQQAFNKYDRALKDLGKPPEVGTPEFKKYEEGLNKITELRDKSIAGAYKKEDDLNEAANKRKADQDKQEIDKQKAAERAKFELDNIKAPRAELALEEAKVNKENFELQQQILPTQLKHDQEAAAAATSAREAELNLRKFNATGDRDADKDWQHAQQNVENAEMAYDEARGVKFSKQAKRDQAVKNAELALQDARDRRDDLAEFGTDERQLKRAKLQQQRDQAEQQAEIAAYKREVDPEIQRKAIVAQLEEAQLKYKDIRRDQGYTTAEGDRTSRTEALRAAQDEEKGLRREQREEIQRQRQERASEGDTRQNVSVVEAVNNIARALTPHEGQRGDLTRGPEGKQPSVLEALVARSGADKVDVEGKQRPAERSLLSGIDHVQDKLILVRQAIERADVDIVNAIANLRSGGGGSDGEGMAEGGPIEGPGPRGVDGVHIVAAPGEYMMSERATSHYGHGFMHALNNLRVPKFSLGGLIEGVNNMLSPAIPHFAVGGPITAPATSNSGMRPLSLTIGNQTIHGLQASESATKAIERAAVDRQLHSGGRKPSWYT